MKLTISEIISACNCEPIVAVDNMDRIVSEFCWDSRMSKPGGLFFALVGASHDGNDYITDVATRRAALIIASRWPTEQECDLAMQNNCALAFHQYPLLAIQELARFWRAKITARVVAVTGSSGKTSTKEMLNSVLSLGFKTICSKANQNNELGLPATILACEDDTEVLICEMGMRGFGQIAELCEIAKPHIAVITNVGQAHLELLGSKENIARAKAELLKSLSDKSGVAVLNGDDAYSSFIREISDTVRREIAVIQFGLGRQNEVRATAIEYDEMGCASFDLWAMSGDTIKVSLDLAGEHAVYNALAAVAVAWQLNMSLPDIVRGIKQAKPQAMRQTVLELKNGIRVIDDSYNANPDSMRAALKLLAQMPKKHARIAVLGDMAELGADKDQLHFDIGRFVSDNALDALIAVGNLAKSYIGGARSAGMSLKQSWHANDNAEAYQLLLSLLAANAAVNDSWATPIILIKGSRCMNLDALVQLIDKQLSLDMVQMTGVDKTP